MWAPRRLTTQCASTTRYWTSMETVMCGKLAKLARVRFSETPFNVSRVVPCGRTDMAKLTDAFSIFFLLIRSDCDLECVSTRVRFILKGRQWAPVYWHVTTDEYPTDCQNLNGRDSVTPVVWRPNNMWFSSAPPIKCSNKVFDPHATIPRYSLGRNTLNLKIFRGFSQSVQTKVCIVP
jgi:hypothetical protein